MYFWISDFYNGSHTSTVARNKDHVLKVFAKSQVLRNAWASEKRADGNQQYRANASRTLCYAGAPGRRDGGNPVQINGIRGRYVAYVLVFLGSVICWLYKLTLSDQAHVTAAESSSIGFSRSSLAGTEGAEEFLYRVPNPLSASLIVKQ
jgi:hypothetical protein